MKSLRKQLCLLSLFIGRAWSLTLARGGPGANVKVTNDLTGAARTAASGADGHYEIPQSNVGSYNIVVKPIFEKCNNFIKSKGYEEGFTVLIGHWIGAGNHGLILQRAMVLSCHPDICDS